MDQAELRNKRTSGYLTVSAYNRLDRLARQQRRTMSSMVSLALEQWLDEHHPVQGREARGKL